MRRTQTRRRHVLAALFAAALGVAACNSDTPTPVGPPPPPAGPTPPAGSSNVISIGVIVPAIAPGQTIQLAVRVLRSNGTQETVSEGVRWTTTFSRVLQITSSGVATGQEAGEARVFANYGGRSANATVLVLPENTYRLSGFVRDFGFGVPDVTVAVASGTGTGLTTTTASDGSYRLYGVAGSIGLQLKKDGYKNASETANVTGHDTRDLSIAVDGTRRDYSGAYTLTLRADTGCTGLPSSLRQRTYSAELKQEGGRITVSLGGGQFIMNGGRGNGFNGYLDGTGTFSFPISDVVIDSSSYYYYYTTYTGSFDIAERIDDQSLLVSGTAIASDANTGLTGRLDGYLRTTFRTSPPFMPFQQRCYSTKHTFEMVRR